VAKSDERDEHVLWPKPLGLIRATETALFIAAPLLSAGALSLIGVVCADAERIRLAGPTLLLLVAAVIALMLSIQLGYHARQWIYSYEEIQNWTGRHEPHPADLELQRQDCRKGEEKLARAGIAYNTGTLLLACGVAAVLVPTGTGVLSVWRWLAVCLVSAAAVGEAVWTVHDHRNWFSRLLRPREIPRLFRRREIDPDRSHAELESQDV
jgi:hypothetical protein